MSDRPIPPYEGDDHIDPASSLLELKSKFMQAVDKVGRRFDSMAGSYSVEAIRRPSNKEQMDRAREYVIKSDTAEETVKMVIDLIHVHWPKLRKS